MKITYVCNILCLRYSRESWKGPLQKSGKSSKLSPQFREILKRTPLECGRSWNIWTIIPPQPPRPNHPRHHAPGQKRVSGVKGRRRADPCFWRLCFPVNRSGRRDGAVVDCAGYPRPASPNTASPRSCMEPRANVTPCVSRSVLS